MVGGIEMSYEWIEMNVKKIENVELREILERNLVSGKYFEEIEKDDCGWVIVEEKESCVVLNVESGNVRVEVKVKENIEVWDYK
jgi:hypothetical protein